MVFCRFFVRSVLSAGVCGATGALVVAPAWADPISYFSPGDLVVSIYGDGSNTGSYGDNQAAPITLQELSLNGTAAATPVGTLELPQSGPNTAGGTPAPGANWIISGEYGSSSEGTLQLAANGQSLVIAGYGVNANTYNTGGAAVFGNAALAQSTSLSTSTTFTPVPRVIADIGANGAVDTTTALYNVFNTNNPRSVATVNGSSFYISGQGVSGDTTEGVFFALKGASSATAVNTTFDTRSVEINPLNNTLYVSQDSKVGNGQTAFLGQVGTTGTLPTGAAAVMPLPGIVSGSPKSPDAGSLTLGSGNGNNVNGSSGKIFLSPENYFFANASTIYLADGGAPKAGGAGDGGLQKWSLVNSNWVLDYTLSSGLNLVNATTNTDGTSGLIGLTGEVIGNSVELFATSEGISDLDPTFLYGITDTLADTTAAQANGEAFTQLEAAPADTIIRGVAFAPVPEPASLAVIAMGLAAIVVLRRRGVAAG
jgi:hypothetical protein